jgi:hypothetical protein
MPQVSDLGSCKGTRHSISSGAHEGPRCNAAGAAVVGSQGRRCAHFTRCPNRLASSPGEPPGRPKQKLERQARPPTGTANAVRLALRNPTHGERDANALHQGLRVPEVGLPNAICARPSPYVRSGGSLRRFEPAREEIDGDAWTPTGAADEMRLGLRRAATASRMRTHFTVCAERPAASGHAYARTGRQVLAEGRRLSLDTHRGRR